jgi:hypothetical protein
MTIKIGSSANNHVMTINDVPKDVLLIIFQALNLAGCRVARQVNHLWKTYITDPTTIYGQYTKAKDSAKKFSSLSPRFSAWMPMPRHWALENNFKVSFTSACQDIIAFSPLRAQSSKIFSFTSSTSFSDKNVFLNRYGNTYFFTPQEQSDAPLMFISDLEPLASHKLIVINTIDSRKNREFSILVDPAQTIEELINHQIISCFPVTEEKVAILATNGKVSFWNLSPEKPACYHVLQIEQIFNAIHVGGWLILEKQAIDLTRCRLIELPFSLKKDKVITFDSSFCELTRASQPNQIRYFTMSTEERLEKRWDISLSEFCNNIDSKNGSILSVYLQEMNEKHIVLIFYQECAVNLLVLSTKGNFINSIVHPLDKKISRASMHEYPIFAHLWEDILVYKEPLKNTLYFFHIPSKQRVHEFEWSKAVWDLPLFIKTARVQDIHYKEGKLTILLSGGHQSQKSINPVQFRLFQFDLQASNPPSVWGKINSVWSFVKGAYYALPGKNPY